MPVKTETRPVTMTVEEVVIRMTRTEARALARLLGQGVKKQDLERVNLYWMLVDLIEEGYIHPDDAKPDIWGQWTRTAEFDEEWPHQ